MADWEERFFGLANHIGAWSKDRSTKVGCVIVGPSKEIVSAGYNGFPRGVTDDVEERHQRPQKYKWTEHAERNAIYNAARIGVSTHGCSMYMPWYPCCDCARAIIQSGIGFLFCGRPDFNDERWGKDFVIADQMFKEAAITVIYRREDA